MLQILITLGLSLFMTSNAFAKTALQLGEAKKRCLTHFSESPEVFADDFSWGYTLLEMEDRFEEIYHSGKRLNMHSLYDPITDQFMLFYDDKKHLPVPIDGHFIKSVTNQIEIAIEKGYASFVFFPDMGHSHLYFPEQHWQDNYAGENAPQGERNNLYTKMLADPKMKALYHLAEQLQMQNEDQSVIDDETLTFKYWHRNFVGYNDGSTQYQIEVAPPEKKFNTVGSIAGYKVYSAGFAISASKDGCFPYQDKDGKTRYFDIGLQDPRYDPNKPQIGFGY